MLSKLIFISEEIACLSIFYHSLLFTLRNNIFSKFESDNLLLVGRKILPPTLKSRSTDAEDGKAALNFKNISLIVGYFTSDEVFFVESAINRPSSDVD
jgi:hypothetical protein